VNTFTRWPSVDRSPTPTGWARPGNLMPADVPRSWPRGRRGTSEAEEILATAEAWWDVDRSGFRDGDRFLRNIGTAGSALDLRLGSSGVANSNDPKYLAPADVGYCYMIGSGTNYLSLNLTVLTSLASLDFAARVSFDSLGSIQTVAGWASTHAGLRINADNTLRVHTLTTAFANIGGANSSAAVPSITAGTPVWIRGRVTLATAACDYWYSYDATNDESAVSWTALGATVTGTNAGVSPVLTQSTTPLWGNNTTSAGGLAGLLLAGAERVDGTVRVRFDCDAITSGAATTFVATSGQTVSIQRATSGRKSVAMPSKTKGGRPCMLLGTDDYMECQDSAQHGLLNFGQGDSFTALAAFRKFDTTNYDRLLSKRGTNGWLLAIYSNQDYAYMFNGSASVQRLGTVTWTTGNLSVLGMIVRRDAQTLRAFANGTLGATVSTVGFGSVDTTGRLQVGRDDNATAYISGQFYAAAVFRRALTAREITVINNAAPWGV